MIGYLFGSRGAAFVTDKDGVVSLVPGVPILRLEEPQTGLLANLVSDADAFFSPSVVGLGAGQSLLPVLVTDADVFFAPVVGVGADVQTLLPGLVTAPETFFTPSIAVGAPRALFPSKVDDNEIVHAAFSIDTVKLPKEQRLRPPRVTDDVETIFAARFSTVPPLVVDVDIIFAAISYGVYTLQPALVPSDDAFAAPALGLVATAGTVANDDAVLGPTISLFLVPVRVVDADAIPAADVGWQVITEFVVDADAVFVPLVEAYNGLWPAFVAEEDVIDTYPFFLQQLEGGIPVPKPPGILTGSLVTPRRLAGSLGKRRVLTGSLSNKARPVLTGSLKRRR